MSDPGQLVAVGREADGVNPTAAIEAVGELGHQVLEGHLGAPGRRRRLLLDVLHVAAEDPDLKAGGSRGQQAVVGMPVEGGHGGLDGLLDVLGHPPVILGLEVADGDESSAGADRELVLIGAPLDASGRPVDPEQDQRVLPLVSLGVQAPDVGVTVGRAGDDAIRLGRPIDPGHPEVVLVQLGNGPGPLGACKAYRGTQYNTRKLNMTHVPRPSHTGVLIVLGHILQGYSLYLDTSYRGTHMYHVWQIQG